MCRTVVMAVAVVGLLLGSEALAQRDAGAKARGEYGKGFWSSGSNRRATSTVPRRMMTPTRSTNSIAETPAAESYRSFSYEPAPEATNEATNAKEAPVEVSAAPTPTNRPSPILPVVKIAAVLLSAAQVLLKRVYVLAPEATNSSANGPGVRTRLLNIAALDERNRTYPC